MLNDQSASTSHDTENEAQEQIREIHALTPYNLPHTNRGHRREPWETHSNQSSSMSIATIDGAPSENFTTMSREFSALVLAGSSVDHNNTSIMNFNGNEEEEGSNNVNNNLGRIGEDDLMEETNPLAIVPDNNPLNTVPSSRRGGITNGNSSSSVGTISGQSEVTVQRVKKEEVEAKISAWQNAKVAKINNRFKREGAVINGWENEQVQKATSWMKKVERKLEEKRAKALEKMQNQAAKAHRKAEERRASAEAKRGTKVARVLEIANLMKAVGRAPTKRSFF
ncbi:remorin 4.1-like [Gastrolobium bilobum]|uniref:remorin 4.1-like n=1 Tax=Gastrolobium bilobum TaxID=150636 RepID=UPI002AB1C011|nr:remorin 4.1-like [Gastrolobium bilobum]